MPKLALVLVLVTAGCKDPHGALSDAPSDATVLDATVSDAAGPDGGPPDSGLDAAGPPDARLADAPIADASMADASVADAAPVDGMPDAARDAMLDAAPDADPACPQLAIMDDGTEDDSRQDIVMSLVQPYPGGTIELYNTTDEDRDFATESYSIRTPSYPAAWSLKTGVVKSHGYMSIAWPFDDERAGGEIGFYYADNWYDVMDFICWDQDPFIADGTSRHDDAVQVHKWSGACVGAMTGTAIERKNDVTGVSPSNYDPTSTRAPLDCP